MKYNRGISKIHKKFRTILRRYMQNVFDEDVREIEKRHPEWKEISMKAISNRVKK